MLMLKALLCIICNAQPSKITWALLLHVEYFISTYNLKILIPVCVLCVLRCSVNSSCFSGHVQFSPASLSWLSISITFSILYLSFPFSFLHPRVCLAGVLGWLCCQYVEIIHHRTGNRRDCGNHLNNNNNNSDMFVFCVLWERSCGYDEWHKHKH